jgi:pimeloyl-ACP methyl ester carboxylesterase
VVGEHDAVTPLADAEAMRKGITRSRLAIVPDAGHLSNLEQPEAFSKVVEDFLIAGS